MCAFLGELFGQLSAARSFTHYISADQDWELRNSRGMGEARSIVVTGLQEVDPVLRNEVHDSMLLRQPPGPSIRPLGDRDLSVEVWPPYPNYVVDLEYLFPTGTANRKKRQGIVCGWFPVPKRHLRNLRLGLESGLHWL